MSSVEKDLYILVGRYEASQEMILNRLNKIDERLEEGTEAFNELRSEMTNHEYRIQDIEKHGIPRRTRLKVDGSLILGIINSLVTLVKAWMGG